MPPALDDDDDDDEQPVRAAAGHAVAEVAAPPTLVSTAVGVQATAFDDGADAGATSASVGVGTTVDVGTDYSHWGWVFEVDKDRRLTGTIKIPRKVWDDFPSGMYRAVPYESVGGESERSPPSFNIMSTQPMR